MGKDQELLEAARKGNVAVVEKILGQRAKRSGPLASLRRGPGANVQDSSGYSSLHHAALNGHKEIVKLLLEHDASTNIVDSKGSSPLHLAAWSGNVDIVRLLLSGPSICNVNLTTKDDETALHCAAQYGHTQVVSVLLEHACDPGIRNCRGETALELAAQYGRLDTVELLVRTDPSLIQCLKRTTPDTVFPHTPLHLASKNGHKAVVEVLLRAGFSVNMRTKAGTALHEAALYGKVEVVRTLLEHGVNTSIRDSNNHTVMDLLSQFNTAQASQEIMHILKRHKRGLPLVDSDGESVSHPFPTVPNTDSDLGSPYENVRPSSKNARSITTDPSPGTSPQRWGDFLQRHARPPEAFDDRRVSGVSGISIMNHRNAPSRDVNENEDTYVPMTNLRVRNTKPYQSLPIMKRTKPRTILDVCPLDGITFNFKDQLDLRKTSIASTLSYQSATSCGCQSNSDSSRESDNSLYQIPCVPKQFMDSIQHSEDFNYLSASRESDQISVSSTASSCGYYPKRPDSGGIPLYIPMNNPKGGHSPGSNNKVSPTPPKKPPRRNISISPTHIQPMSMSVDGVSNSAYEYLFLAHSGTRSQGNLNDFDKENRRERLSHGRSMDQYVEMNVFNIALEDEPERPRSELQRGKSEDLDSRKKHEPIAITSMYENMIIKQQNPRRKLRRHPEVYEEYDFRRKHEEPIASSSAPETTFVSSAFIMISDENTGSSSNSTKSEKKMLRTDHFPLSPTHYNQPPTPDHPPPSAMQAESIIYEKIRPLSQEYKRRSKDMETETEDEYLLIYDGSSGSFSSSVSLSDRSVDNILEEYNSEIPFAGLIKGATTKVLENINPNTPAERPTTLKKLKRFYEGTNGEGIRSDNEKSSSSEKEFDNKENKENRDQHKDRVSALSPFDEQEEWAKIQEIMASFGTGIVRESVFVAELEKEFQSRLMTISCSQHSLANSSADNVSTVEKWLQGLGMGDYVGLFMTNGFDDLNFLNGIMEESDLKDMGITSELERQIILDSIKSLPSKVSDSSLNVCNNNNEQNTVRSWLVRISLEQYYETFVKHLYHDMERVKRIWDVELSAVLDIEKVGHRKRILVSVSSGEHIVAGPKLEAITEFGSLKNTQPVPELPSPSTYSVNSNTGTIRHRHKKSRPAPPPPVKKEPEKKLPTEIYVGGSNSIKSQWRHQPILLITSFVKYTANYLGSTLIKEFKGTESTKKSIQTVIKSKDHPSEEICLSISYKGVKFVNPIAQKVICEHEIKNMNCVCQDMESQSYFAYITKDCESFYCHVFQAVSPEQAIDIILTLGQAFELAYQMAVRDQVTSKGKSQKDTYKPAVSPGAVSSNSRDFKDTSTRNADVKLNGHPLKMMPLTLSIAAEPGSETTLQTTPSKVSSKKAQQ
ncbi:ankyrin repeat and SAM domain-containing protein 1A-like isoform X2 [Diabrotica virgifera virgifera]|uniref:Ankyrin repeat and SAM domain-containing protein 1A-like n=1 Tax=Diabrotica virgifera virgifera TaxID=50390 RepID=A0ABM5I954_DIAVI|nr:ankyrin repeat and SAM domain-containing protein 1A-like isoform X2 [Diabrotica virgifera virgifera]